MPARRIDKAQVHAHWIHSSRLHVVLYSLLLIATPFVLLQNFLVEMIAGVSGSRVELAGHSVPIVPVAALLVAVAALIYFRSRITGLRILAVVIVVLMNALGQQIADYYFDHNFYDLQQNWHYIAYGLFSYMVYRDLAPRGRSLARIMLTTYLVAMGFSTFDEAFQMRLSSRVFDISDIGKDVLGTLLGMVLIYLGGSQAAALLADCKRIRHRKLRDYLKHPFSLLILMIVLAYLLVIFGSLMSDFEHWPLVVAFTLGGFVVFFFVFHTSQYRWCKYGLLLVLGIAIVVQSCFYVRHRADHIVHNQYGLTVYKGIPIVFFDVLIFPDGSFRLVDKKHYFNSRDQRFFLKHQPDILLIGSGSEGRGGNGFFEKSVNQFVYNRFIQRGTQVIILKTPEACELFNRLKREGKNVLFVLHNTC